MTDTVKIDPEFHALCPPLSTEEYQQLEANIIADGCREPLVMWQEGAFLLDGHNRYTICEEHGLPFALHCVSLPSRDEAITWIVNNQLGRRNLTEEQKSYLRGKRYNREKKTPTEAGAMKGQSLHQNEGSSQAAVHLAEEYHVSPATIERDGQFAAALDTLEDQVRADIRNTVLARHDRGKQQATKKQVTQAGKLIQEKTVERLPFMQREGWRQSQVLGAIELLGELPKDEHQAINLFLDQPFTPAEDGLAILRNLQRHTPAQRQHLYALLQSSDPRERSLAKTLAAKKAPRPDPQVTMAGNLIRDVDKMRDYQRRNWRLQFLQEPWIPELEAIDAALAAIQDRWRTIITTLEAAHAERIATYAEAFES